MLYVLLFVPILTGIVFKFVLPIIETELCGYFDLEAIISPYYLLFDLLLLSLTPYMICFASSMVVLAECDEKNTSYFAVTPVGKKGYIISRVFFPVIIAFVFSVIILSVFSLTDFGILTIILLCFLSNLSTIAIPLLIVAFSHNRVEGMGVAKIAGIILIGLVIPFFLSSNIQYLFFFLPTFWIAKVSIDGSNIIAVLFALITSIVWISILFGKFKRKIA